MLTAMLLSLTLAPARPPTLTPEDIYKDRVVEKYSGQRVAFRGWLATVVRDGKRKLYLYEIKAIYHDAAAAGRDQSPRREVTATVIFAEDAVRLRNRFKRAEREGERLAVTVEAKVVKHPLGWRLEEARLTGTTPAPRGK